MGTGKISTESSLEFRSGTHLLQGIDNEYFSLKFYFTCLVKVICDNHFIFENFEKY